MATSLPLPELVFVSPKRLLSTSSSRCMHYRIPLSRSCNFRVLFRTKVNAVREDGVIVDKRESELIKEANGYELGGNGAAYKENGDYRYNGWVNGGVTVVESETDSSNGSLMKYVNGNGVAATVVGEIQASESTEEGRKKRIEEIGKEEAWFKRSEQQQTEV
ncbi:Protein ACTIVITY OF BC1 COMPLEX KINASE 8, chloroplastic, partial [Cucurbita argyrosperma subsp. sororia]